MILIVDDNQENIFSLQRLLHLNRFETDTATSGEDALKKILKNDYSLVILDVQMPGMDGFEVAESITSINKARDIPIIFLSAVNTEKRFVTKGYASGGIDYLTKPFDPDILLMKVKTFYRLYEQSKQLNAAHEALRMAAANLEQRVSDRTRELELMNRELEARNHDLQQFASVASHDLQEPLRKIHVFSNMVRDKFLSGNEEALSYMNRILSSSQRMSNLINDLLMHSGLSVSGQFEKVDMNAMVREVLTDLELTIEEKNAKVELCAIPAIEAIPGQIRQALQNILSNALKFCHPERLPVISIKGERTASVEPGAPSDENGDFCRITISDNGIGFEDIYSEKIFTIFQRLNPRATYDGTGIGLAIVKKIVEKHNGFVWAHGREHYGATFTLILPLSQKRN